MKEIKISIHGKRYNVKVAETEENLKKGLMDVSELPEDEGMLFVFEEPDNIGFWMKDTKIPLDIVFINEELEVISVKQGIPFSEEIISENNVNFVLEVNSGSGIEVGDELEFSPDKSIKNQKMLVLNSNAEVQMELDGNERIFSRPNTKTLIKFAKKAASSDNEKDYIALGKRVFKFLQQQEDRPAEYVEQKSNN